MPHHAYAQTLLDLAAQVERDEARIKRHILHAARRRDHARVERLVTRWLRLPVSQVIDEDDISDEDTRDDRSSDEPATPAEIPQIRTLCS